LVDNYKYSEPIILPQKLRQETRTETTDVTEELVINTEGCELISIYPNPANDYLTVEYKLNEKVKTTELVIVDITGKIVKTAKLKTGNSKQETLIETNDLQSGIYFCNFVADGITIKTKIVAINK
jgi:hypothetical protein